MITGTIIGFFGCPSLVVSQGIVFSIFTGLAKAGTGSETPASGRTQDNYREESPVRQRIAAALRTECEALYRVFIHGEFSIAEWQAWHDALKVLVESDAGAKALGEKYISFVDALKYDQLSINVQIKHEAEWVAPARIGTAVSPSAAYRIAMHDAYFEQNVSTVLMRYAPLLLSLGLEEDASKFGEQALSILSSRTSRYLGRPYSRSAQGARHLSVEGPYGEPITVIGSTRSVTGPSFGWRRPPDIFR